jgi:hypothetical protein
MIEALDDEPLLHAVIGALDLPNGKNLARNALEHFSQVDIVSLLQ